MPVVVAGGRWGASATWQTAAATSLLVLGAFLFFVLFCLFPSSLLLPFMGPCSREKSPSFPSDSMKKRSPVPSLSLGHSFLYRKGKKCCSVLVVVVLLLLCSLLLSWLSVPSRRCMLSVPTEKLDCTCCCTKEKIVRTKKREEKARAPAHQSERAQNAKSSQKCPAALIAPALRWLR